MSDPLTWASDATYTSGSESGSPPTADPGAAAAAQGFLPDVNVRAAWLNWVLKGLKTGFVAADAVVTAAYIAADAVVTTAFQAADTTITTAATALALRVTALEGFFTATKLKNVNLGLLDGGAVTLAALLTFVLSGLTSHVVHEQGSFAIGAGGSGRVKKRFSYLRTTDATANQVLDSYTPGNDVSGLIDAWVLAINRTTTTEEAVYHIRHGFVNRGGTTTLIGAVNLLATEDDAAWACSSNVSTPAVRIVVTGEASNNIDWIVFWTISEMTHPT